jgi:hypothetical protein
MTDAMLDAIVGVLQFIPSMTDDEFDVMKRAQETVRQRHKDGVLVRELAADERRRTARPPTPSVRVEGAGAVVSGGDGAAHGGGWRDVPRLDDWRPPGERAFNAIMDQQDARDRAKRGQG